MVNLFDGKLYLEKKKEELALKVHELRKNGLDPHLASVYLLTDPGSSLYTKLKQKTAQDCGITFSSYNISKKDPDKFIEIIRVLNTDPDIQGILVQKPSGKHDFEIVDWEKIVSAIDPKKDIDGLTPENLGLLSIGTPRFIPATAKAVLEILKFWDLEIKGKHIVIIGASEILGRPLSMLLTDRGATVSILHSRTDDISRYTKEADILISATGVPELISSDMVKKDSAVIDVGAPHGDVRTEEVKEIVKYLSPVPGGIGPVTIASLLDNLVTAI
jgi:methylenetetrahydrofolate dehydrogenase (NADP+)/methenyltetrahydrofolate cyclohydrolase